MGRLLSAALTVKHFGRSGRGGLFGGEGRRQQYWRTLDIFLYPGSSFYVLRAITLAKRADEVTIRLLTERRRRSREWER